MRNFAKVYFQTLVNLNNRCVKETHLDFVSLTFGTKFRKEICITGHSCTYWKNIIVCMNICTYVEQSICMILYSARAQHLQRTSARSFLNFFTSKSGAILPHEYRGLTSRKIPKPQSLHPKLESNLLSNDPNFTPSKKLFLMGFQFYFKILCSVPSYCDPQLFIFFELTILLVANQN